MYLIGITGGIGAGKSELLSELKKRKDSVVVQADLFAGDLMKPGGKCYKRIIELFEDEDVFDSNGNLISEAVSRSIFTNEELRRKMNNIVHPEVKNGIRELIKETEKSGDIKLFFLEAALLLEDGYDSICDEIWYIYASADTRRKRLMENRGYSREKTDAIMAAQLGEEVFRKRCQRIIDNDGKLLRAKEQLLSFIEEVLKKSGMPAKETQR